MTETKIETTPKYVTVRQLASMGFLPAGGIRHLIFSSKEFNQKVVCRVGKKILIDLQALYDYIDQSRGGE
jgi:hypothetical protein